MHNLKIKKHIAKYGYINWSMIDQFIISASNFLLNIVLLRTFGLGEFGRYSLVWLVVQFSCNIQMSLFLIPMMSLGPKQSSGQNRNYYNVIAIHQFTFSILSSLLFFVVFFAVDIFFNDWQLMRISCAVSFAVLCVQFQEFIRRYLLTVGLYRQALLIDTIRYLGILAVLFCIKQFMEVNLSGLLWIIALLSAVASFVGCLWCCEFSFKTQCNLEILKINWFFSKWILASNVINFASGNVYLIPLAALGGKEAVGAIRAVLNLTGLFNPFLAGLENFMPRVSSIKLKTEGVEGLMKYIKNCCIYGTLALITMEVWVLCFADNILEFVCGVSYASLSDLLAIAFITVIASYIGTPIGIALRTIEETKGIFSSVIISSILNIILSYPIVLLLNKTGVVLGMMIGKLVLVGLMMCWLVRSLNSKKQLVFDHF